MSGYRPLGDHKSMEGLIGMRQAEIALHQVLTRIRDHERVGFLIGPGSQTFDLVTEAYATLKARPVAEIRKEYAPREGGGAVSLSPDRVGRSPLGPQGPGAFSQT